MRLGKRDASQRLGMLQGECACHGDGGHGTCQTEGCHNGQLPSGRNQSILGPLDCRSGGGIGVDNG